MLRLTEVETPVPQDDEVRVRVHAATVNRTDTGFRCPEYLLVRLVGGLLTPKHKNWKPACTSSSAKRAKRWGTEL